jgi:hypothetical protein
MDYRTIPIDRLDLNSDRWDDFRLIESGPPGPLQRLVMDHGPVFPPLVWDRTGRGKYALLSGFNVVDMLVESKRDEVAVGIFEGRELDEAAAVRLALYAQTSGRRVSELDKALAVRRLHGRFHFSLARIASLCRLVEGFPGSLSRVEDYLKLASLPPAMREALREGRLHPSEGRLWADTIPAEESEALFDMLRCRVKPGRNTLKAILDLLPGAAATEGMTPLALVETLLDRTDPAGSRRAHAEELLSALRKIRYPVMSREAALFSRRAARLSLPEEITLRRSADPEDPCLTLQMTLHDEKHFRDLLDRLREALDRGGFSGLFGYQDGAMHHE